MTLSKKSRPRTEAAFAKALDLMPGGVNSPARAFGAVGGTPIFVERADGAYLYDLDGNQYLDYIGSWGPMILGHRHPTVVAALEAALTKGTSYGAPTEAESELAERIIDAVASVEKVRLVSSGTEATMSAVRLARGFTGRDVILKFAGNYHGHVDSLLVAAGSSAATLGTPNSPGVTVGTTKDTLVLDYNDVSGLEQAFATHGDKIAGVILEPVVGNMGVVVPSHEFVAALNRLTKKHGALLICDEVMSGFRVAFGGAQHLLGLEPDLTTLGKIVGGGLPVGAYGGRADVMNHILPAGSVFQAGTLSGNPLATAAGCATLKILKEQPPYDRLEQLAARLEAGLRHAAEEAKIPHTIARVGSMMTLFFSREVITRWEQLTSRLEAGLRRATEAAKVSHTIARVGSMMTLFFNSEAITSWQQASHCDTEQYARFFWGMMDRGVYLPCSQYEALFVSAAHTEVEIDRTLTAAEEVLKEIGR